MRNNPRPVLPREVDSLWSEENFARSLRETRVARKLSQERLARELNRRGFSQIHQSSIAKIERPAAGAGRRPISVDEALAICDVLQVPLHEMLLPPELRGDQRALELTAEFFSIYTVTAEASARLVEVIDELRQLGRVPAETFTSIGNRPPDEIADMAQRLRDLAAALLDRSTVQKGGSRGKPRKTSRSR